MISWRLSLAEHQTVTLTYKAYLSCLKVRLSPITIYQLASPDFPFHSLSPSQDGSLQEAYLLSLTPCPGCLGIDWLAPCHWSSLSILTRFGHPLRCGQRVGGWVGGVRYVRRLTAPGDKVKRHERKRGQRKQGMRGVCEPAGQQQMFVAVQAGNVYQGISQEPLRSPHDSHTMKHF